MERGEQLAYRSEGFMNFSLEKQKQQRAMNNTLFSQCSGVESGEEYSQAHCR